MRHLAAALVLVLAGTASAPARDLSQLYPEAVLRHWAGRYPENLRWNFQNLVLGSLTPAERARVGSVDLSLPLLGEGSLRGDPLAFYAAPGRITVPILSVKFFDDLTLAWAFLWANGYSLETVTDYVAVLKYRSPASVPGGRFPPPLDTLGVPADAWKADPRVDDVSQKALKSAVVWILAHELGHIYHRHPGYGPDVSAAEAQANEEQADRFATAIMRRIGVAPVGMVQFFMVMAHWAPNRGDFRTDEAWEAYLRSEATHPLTARRLQALAEDLRLAPRDFTAEEFDQRTAVERILYIAGQIEGIADILGSPDIQRTIVAKALATDLASLKPRRPGALLGDPEARDGGPPFLGTYRGPYSRYLADGRKEWLASRMDLERSGTRVTGRFGFGLGEGHLEGLVVNEGRLVFEWRWGNAHGRGILEAGEEAGVLRGTWGHGDSVDDGGTWELQRQ